MFDWVEMDVIDVPPAIHLVTYLIFPKPALPDRLLALMKPAGIGGFSK